MFCSKISHTDSAKPPCMPHPEREKKGNTENFKYSPGLSSLKMIEASLPLQCCWFESQQGGRKFTYPVTTRSWRAANITLPTLYKFSRCAVEEGTQAPTTGVELVGSQQRKSVVVLGSSCVNV